MTTRAHVLSELLAVVGIISLVAAVVYPIYSASKKKENEEVTCKNLRQVWLSLELYRQDHDASTLMSGTSSELKLPDKAQFFALLNSSQIDWWNDRDLKGYGPIYYPIDHRDFPSTVSESDNQQLSNWKRYSKKHQSESMIIGDFNHTEGCSGPPDKTCVFNGLGVSLDGVINKKSGRGLITDPFWWDH